MNIPRATVSAILAIAPLLSMADHGGCIVNGKHVYDDAGVVEGTKKADTINCANSNIGLEIYGYGGNDTITGTAFDDFIAGGGGRDIIRGGAGNDAIDGGASDDDLFGEEGNDIIFGGVGASPAAGVGCILRTSYGASTGRYYFTKGGSGDDSIWGGMDRDCINAGSGEDVVYGGDGNDTIYGGNHSDYLDGGLGDDYIEGGWHTDTCMGGGGSNDYIDCEK
jgi:Ca2+-binding RTX toxin-like protein